jgi:hypothetical protein
MAVSARAALIVAASLTCASAGSSGCRSVDVCSTQQCGAPSFDSAGSSDDGSATSSAGVGRSAEPLDQAGAGGAASQGSGGAAGEGLASDEGVLQCEPEMADCDGSRLTLCETNISWSVRHCGACGEACDGLCQGNDCQPATLVWEGHASSMVANASSGFAVSDYGYDTVLLQIDMQTSEATVLLNNVSSSTILAMSSDRVYAFDPDSELFHSARSNGSDLTVEAVPQAPHGLGATEDGVYYLGHTDGDEDASALWFRPTGGSAWQQIHVGAYLEIAASSSFGLLLREFDENDESVLWLVRGSTVSPQPKPPGEWSLGAVTERGPVVLVADSAKSVNELWWTDTDPPRHYEIPWISSSYGRLNVMSDEVVIYYENYGTAYVQHFAPSGPVAGIGGLPSAGGVVYVSTYDLWYTVWDTPITRRFLRARWFVL